MAIHTCIGFGKPTAYICLYHTCQSFLCVGFQQFVVLFFAHNNLCYFNIRAIFVLIYNNITIR